MSGEESHLNSLCCIALETTRSLAESRFPHLDMRWLDQLISRALAVLTSSTQGPEATGIAKGTRPVMGQVPGERVPFPGRELSGQRLPL